MSDLQKLERFMAALSVEMAYLRSKEESEGNRDWGDRNLNVSEVENYHGKLSSELERRETQINSVQVIKVAINI